MVNRFNAELELIHQAASQTEHVANEIKDGADALTVQLASVDGHFQGIAGEQLQAYRKVLDRELRVVTLQLGHISECLETTAIEYGDTDSQSADKITSEGSLADVLRGATAALSGVSNGILGNQGSNSGGDIPPMPTDGSEQEMHDWWDSLTPQQQEQYLSELGNDPDALAEFAWSDGLPAEARHDANMMILENYVDQTGDSDAQHLLDRMEGSREGHPDDQLYLLGFEPPTADSEALVVASTGNPDEAVNTGVVVPGTGANYGDLDGEFERIETLRTTAEEVSGEDTATVMWLGYEAPPEVFDPISGSLLGGPNDATNPSYAADGAENLYNFMTGLDVADQHNGNGTTTIIGHSYGSTMLGHGAIHGDDFKADNVIAVGSPGMGTGSASDLGVDNVFAMTGSSDEIRFTPPEIHGPQPGSMAFGAEGLESDTPGHSDYWEEDSRSLQNQGYVMGGMEDQATRGSASLWGHAGDSAASTAADVGNWASDRASDVGNWTSDRWDDVTGIFR